MYDFWLVWNPAGLNPKHKHLTAEAATTEAERLARANPGNRFYVLHALEYREVNDMQRVVLLKDGRAPF